MKVKTRRPDARELARTLRRTFGIRSLRTGQERVIARVLAGSDTLAIMPTGAGKSLCYQLPALHLAGTTVVVSPLISLMKDQADKLAEAGVAVVTLNSTLGDSDESDALARIARRELAVVFATPERMTDAATIAALVEAGVALFVVDEAHCISQWGHDFRPAYLELGAALELLSQPTVLALTATSTDDVTCDIVAQLQRPAMKVVQTGVYRANLHPRVLHVTNDDERIARVVEFVGEHAGSGIVYAATIAVTEAVFTALRDAGKRAGLYHGKLSVRDRNLQQDAFMKGDIDVIAATNAFGLGIDKPDVRYVLHAQMPGSIESYYQEAGRAGRDGKPADCALIYDLRDRRVQQFFLLRRYPDGAQVAAVHDAIRRLAMDAPVALSTVREALPDISATKIKVAIKLLVDAHLVLRKAGERVAVAHRTFDGDRVADLATDYADKAEHDREKLERMVFYAQTGLCRWRVLLDYFGERLPGERCGSCDNCVRAAERDERAATVASVHPIAVATRKRRGYDIGDEVRVPRYGAGRVTQVAGEEITVEFPDGGARTFLRSYVRGNTRAHRSGATAAAA